jgi:hypothetical protein
MKRRTVLAVAAALVGSSAARAQQPQRPVQRTPAPPNARVYIIAPVDGETMQSPVRVQFGLSGMGVAPAGVERENTGHHHLLIDVDPAQMSMDDPIPADDAHAHFGNGQTEVVIDLRPGIHTLRLLLADAFHIPHDPPVMSAPVRITVL